MMGESIATERRTVGTVPDHHGSEDEHETVTVKYLEAAAIDL